MKVLLDMPVSSSLLEVLDAYGAGMSARGLKRYRF